VAVALPGARVPDASTASLSDRVHPSPRAAVAICAGVGTTMVSIKEFSLGELQRTRRRLRREVLVRHFVGEGVVALGPVLLRLLRVRRDVRCLMERVRGVSATSFNIGTFSTEQALSLFRVKPADVGRVAELLHLEDEV